MTVLYELSERCTDMATSITLPGRDLAAYLSAYVAEMAFGAEAPEVIVDRYHTPDIVWRSDGHPMDRSRLVAHAKPSRKNVAQCRVDVMDTIASGDRVAARYTVTATMRTGRMIVTEVYMFGDLAPDGRLHRVDAITRDLPQPKDAAPDDVSDR
ncbi:nuclear transport factor 2 family protein [Nocardia sp. NPDC046763]|uniref:nuclear transport factor 2 family protein n=1 Tax=Nocardia sp. NPDC046763 TaxID=3155256 RepID=UPI00340151CF